VKPESAAFIAKAEKMLREGRKIAALELGEHVGRAAYLVAFHAAQALIFERTGKSAKTHRGVAGQFVQRLDKELRSLLAKSYKLKAAADYETGEASDVPIERAREALDTAEKFLRAIKGMLG
jgi:uncharacterized protein (UPF0332 family)